MRFSISFGVLLAVWLLLSGKFDAFHVGWGVLGALVIGGFAALGAPGRPFPLRSFLSFLPWELYQILLSNLRVARMVLDPRLPIRPRLMRKTPGLSDPRALTLLGCSITLTPGTLTVDIDDERMLVHALDDVFAKDVEDEVMANQVRKVFSAHRREPKGEQL